MKNIIEAFKHNGDMLCRYAVMNTALSGLIYVAATGIEDIAGVPGVKFSPFDVMAFEGTMFTGSLIGIAAGVMLVAAQSQKSRSVAVKQQHCQNG